MWFLSGMVKVVVIVGGVTEVTNWHLDELRRAHNNTESRKIPCEYSRKAVLT
jgi:hypothetical protein